MNDKALSKNPKNLIMDIDLYKYCEENFLQESPFLQELRTKTSRMPEAHMQTPPLQGQLMGFLLKSIGAKNILEIGTYVGYSTLAMALAIPADGKIITCDRNVEWTKIAQKFWSQSGVCDKIELRLGAALETLDILLQEGKREFFDFIFIDADKQNYMAYYEACLSLLKPKGIIAIDNVLWSGKVIDPNWTDTATQAIRELNRHIHQDKRVEMCLIPIGDGITLVRKV